MGIKNYSWKILNNILKHFNREIVSNDLLYDWQKSNYNKALNVNLKLPDSADTYLNINNPRLIELKNRYAQCDKKVIDHILWSEGHVSTSDLKYFRRHSAYVHQLKGKNIGLLNYILTVYYTKTIDTLGYFKLLEEDDYFGITTFLIDNKVISRDLLDSIHEIYFLEKFLNISKRKELRILDIGAGYGRLAHRMLSALPNISKYFCTDAVYTSTFISEYYLKFRKLENKAKVIPLYDVEELLKSEQIDIALNVHSFSECKLSAIEWWISLLSNNQVKYLMIVPNAGISGGKNLISYDSIDFSGLISSYGYNLVAKKPKYGEPSIQEYGIHPTYHYLFELK